MNKIKEIFARMRKDYIRNRTFKVLSSLSDKQLRDLGYEGGTLRHNIYRAG